MGRKKTIIKNTLSNVIQSVSKVAVGFILAPLVLGYFGKEVFGIRSFIESIVIILNFFSYTIGLSLMKYVPEMISKKRHDSLNELIFAIERGTANQKPRINSPAVIVIHLKWFLYLKPQKN